jgi:erythronate-4-phosphate dehydrogenase
MSKIVADSAIPFAERFFSCIGEVSLLDAEQITSDCLKDADVLVCRTVTLVNQQLLQNTDLSIVASPTSGVDHIDLDYLQNKSIAFGSAPGSNARSVAEYVLSSLCVLADQKGFNLTSKKIGIVGCGNVGSQLRDFFQAIDIECMICDPFLQQESDSSSFCELKDIQQADIISLHVPLTSDGAYPTRSMLDTAFFQGLREGVILVNTSRGEVVDEDALKTFLESNNEAMVVIDVWENEPAIDTALLIRADIATPHIAGYSIDGKLRATQTVFEQVCKVLNIDSSYEELQDVLPVDETREINLTEYENDMDAISMAVLASYDVRSDAAAIRRMLEDNVPDRNSYFAELRNNYPIRREFSSLTIGLPKEADSLRRKLLTLGFHIK